MIRSTCRELLGLAFAVVLAVAYASPCAASDLEYGPEEPEWTGWMGAAELQSPDPRFYAMPASAPEPTVESRWSFWVNVPLYVWWPNFAGKVEVEGLLIDYDLDHGDVLDLILNDLSGFASFKGGVRYDRFAFNFDLLWMQVKRVDLEDINKQVPHPSILDLSQKYDFVFTHPSLSYTLIDTPLDFGIINRFRFDALVGFRYVFFQALAKITDSHIPEEIGQTAIDDTEHYWEVLPVGAEIEVGLFENWSWQTRVMIGGWSMADSYGGTDGMADSVLRYHFHDNWTFDFGIRWLDMKTKGNVIDYELKNSYGPLFAFMLHL
jgi:hypothetical protein